jgi:hypothetical protein
MSYTLRALPLPVKLVASTFLLAVGLGYGSAMVQLHMQDSKSGKPMPTVEDVIKKYTGKVKYDPNNPPPRAVSRIEELIMCPTEEFSPTSMSKAFQVPDATVKRMAPRDLAEMKTQRKGEQAALVLWINTPDAERRQAYKDDSFEPAGKKLPAYTPEYKNTDTGGVKIKSLINDRCTGCHGPGASKHDAPLDSYEGLAVYLPKDPDLKPGEWVKVEEPISTTKLTQSTHAHVLSFAVLFSLTGLIFAFSSYPTWMRCVLGPWVVVAVVADVSLWWAARLSDEWGPFFARGILATGAAAGAGLTAQIGLGLFNMYGPKGKAVLVLLFALGAGGAGALYVNKIHPALKQKEQELKDKKEKKDAEPEKKGEDPKSPVGAGFAGVGKHSTTGSTNGGAKGTLTALGSAVQKTDIVPPNGGKPTSKLDRLVSWPPVYADGSPLVGKPEFTGSSEGNMAAAFFEMDKDYKKIMEMAGVTQAEKDLMKAYREGEAAAMQAWTRTPEKARKEAYEKDAFPIPKALADKVSAGEFVKDGQVQIKSLITARCVSCHNPKAKSPAKEFQLDSYDGLLFYLTEPARAPAGGDAAVRATESPAPVPDPVPTPRPRRFPVVLPVLAILAPNDD